MSSEIRERERGKVREVRDFSVALLADLGDLVAFLGMFVPPS
jgi:hypothetical protein